MTSILKADDIQDSSGNNIINEAGDVITIGGSGDTINVASGATNNLGIAEADMFRLTADTNQNTTGFVTSNWERVDTDGFGKIGTGLTESSGVFSFPSTGIYLITGFANMDVDGGDTNAVWELYTTPDNASYDIAAAMGTGEGSGTGIRSVATIIFQLDVTNTTNVKFK